MSNQRKQIIINEIAFWKKNKMLPDHYCDFLTSLYTGGGSAEDEPLNAPNDKQSILAREKKKFSSKFIIFPFIVVALIAGLQFVPFDWIAIAIGAVVGVALSIYGIRLAFKKNVAAPVLHMSGALLILTMSVKIVITYFEGSNTALFVAIAFNSLFWVLLGAWQKLIYFFLAGIIGIGIIVVYAFIGI